MRSQLRQRASEYLLAAYDTQGTTKSKAELARERKLDPGAVQRWISSLESWGKQPHAIFGPWFAFAALPERVCGTRQELAGVRPNRSFDQPTQPTRCASVQR